MAAAAPAAMPAEGDRAPALDLVDQAGRRVRLAGYKGSPVVLFFVPRAATPG